MTKHYKNVSRETPPLDDLGTMQRIEVKKFLDMYDNMTTDEKVKFFEMVNAYEQAYLENKSE